MPPLWKKSKMGRVSQFLSDLKSSTKHGESLVVETGFPTSLVDLMIKNRDRWKKPPKKKKQSSSVEMMISSPILQSPPPPHNFSVLPEFSSCPRLPHVSPLSFSSSSSNSTMLIVPASPSTNKTVIKTHFLNDEKEEEIVKVSTPNRSFMLILKVLFLLILAMATKKIAIGITILASMLLLLELAGMNLSCFLKPCSDAKESYNYVVNRIMSSVHSIESNHNEIETTKDNNNSGLVEQEEKTSLDENCGFVNDNSGNSCIGAVIIAEDDRNTNEEIQLEPGFDSLHCGCRWGFVESEQKKKTSSNKVEELNEDENIKSSKKKGSVKFKSNMIKNFVPKKFRGSKKKKRNSEECYVDSSCEFVSNCIGEEENLMTVEEEQGQEEDDDDDQDQEEPKGDDNDVVDENDDDQVHASSEFSQIELETDCGANAGKITSWKSQQLIPFVIILAGLIGGRFIALLITLFWCLLVKSVMRTAMRN